MNIDDLKDSWNQDKPNGMHLPGSTAMLGKTTSAVQRIRKNMRAELIAILVSYAVLIIYIVLMSVYGGPLTSFFFNMISVLLFTMLMLNCFYYFRFYVFYKSISRYDLSTIASVRKITYELELNTEIYKTYNICVAPIGVLLTITLIAGKTAFDYIQNVLASDHFFSSGKLLFVFAVILISFILTYFSINRHVRIRYGKDLAELKRIMDDLGNED